MQKLETKLKELVEATLIIGVARGEGNCNSSYDSKKEKIKGSVDGIVARQFEIASQTAIDFADWLNKLSPSQKTSVWSKNGERSGLFTMDNEQLFDKFEKQYTSDLDDDDDCAENSFFVKQILNQK